MTDLEKDTAEVTEWFWEAQKKQREFYELGVLDADEFNTNTETLFDVYLNRIEELTAAEDELTAARESALTSVQGLIDNIMGSSDLPQSKEYMTGRYDDLYASAISDPEAVSDFTSFASTFLDFMTDYGDPSTTESILSDLRFLSSDHELGASFAGGGIISGPMSGYTLPTTFHGVEHITTDSDMQDVKSLLRQLVNKSSNSNGGDTQIRVFIGNKELKSHTAEVIRTDPETQTQIRRVARV